ncbi:MAG: LOG family protein [Holosporales bacterium]|nr:LOG family protein [Holosporales bacterium]
MTNKNLNSLELAQGDQVLKDDYNLSEILAKSPDKRLVILGGNGIKQDSYYYLKTVFLTRTVAQAGISVMTGGGAGIMEAANKGAKTANSSASSYGLRVESIGEEISASNSYIDKSCGFMFKTLAVRLITLLSSANAIVFFPGGFGTLEELFSLLVRLKIGIMNNIPVYLYGSKFWSGLISWLDNTVRNEGVINEEHLKLFKIEDDIEKISKDIISCCMKEN